MLAIVVLDAAVPSLHTRRLPVKSRVVPCYLASPHVRRGVVSMKCGVSWPGVARRGRAWPSVLLAIHIYIWMHINILQSVHVCMGSWVVVPVYIYIYIYIFVCASAVALSLAPHPLSCRWLPYLVVLPSRATMGTRVSSHELV